MTLGGLDAVDGLGVVDGSGEADGVDNVDDLCLAGGTGEAVPGAAGEVLCDGVRAGLEVVALLHAAASVVTRISPAAFA